MEHTAGVPNRFCCSSSAPLFSHVLPLVAIARKKPIVGQVVPESSLRATSTVVIPDGSFRPGGGIGRIDDDQPCAKIDDDQARVYGSKHSPGLRFARKRHFGTGFANRSIAASSSSIVTGSALSAATARFAQLA
jgi:hypothetical protein